MPTSLCVCAVLEEDAGTMQHDGSFVSKDLPGPPDDTAFTENDSSLASILGRPWRTPAAGGAPFKDEVFYHLHGLRSLPSSTLCAAVWSSWSAAGSYCCAHCFASAGRGACWIGSWLWLSLHICDHQLLPPCPGHGWRCSTTGCPAQVPNFLSAAPLQATTSALERPQASRSHRSPRTEAVLDVEANKSERGTRKQITENTNPRPHLLRLEGGAEPLRE